MGRIDEMWMGCRASLPVAVLDIRRMGMRCGRTRRSQFSTRQSRCHKGSLETLYLTSPPLAPSLSVITDGRLILKVKLTAKAYPMMWILFFLAFALSRIILRPRSSRGHLGAGEGDDPFSVHGPYDPLFQLFFQDRPAFRFEAPSVDDLDAADLRLHRVVNEGPEHFVGVVGTQTVEVEDLLNREFPIPQLLHDKRVRSST